MGEALKVLGQSTPPATILTDLYTVPSSFSAVVSSITICNQNSSTTAHFRVSVAPGGAADAVEQYVYYDLPLLNNDTFIATIGISLAMNDVIRVQSDTANVSFNLLGVEVGSYGPPPTNLAGGDLDGYYPNPTVVALQGNAVYSETLGYGDNGYVLTWDGVDGYWEALPGGAVIFEDTVSGGSLNITSSRSVDQSPTTTPSLYQGIVNLSSDTTGVTLGADGNFVTIMGGDQNVAQSDYCSIGGGFQNVINSSDGYSTVAGGQFNIISSQYGFIGGGSTNTLGGSYSSVIAGGGSNTVSGSYGFIGGGTGNNIVSGEWGTIGGGTSNLVYAEYGTIAGGYNNVSYGGSIVGGSTNTASTGGVAGGFATDASGGEGAIALGWNVSAGSSASAALGYACTSYMFGQVVMSSSGGNITGGGSQSSQNGNVVYSMTQPTVGSPFVLTDANFPQSEFVIAGSIYYNLTINIVLMAGNAAVGPAYWSYNVLAHLAGGLAVIDNQQQTITSVMLNPSGTSSGNPDPNVTNWLTSITVDGTTNLLHINIDPNGDVANTINACADIKWVEVGGFAQ